MSDIFILQKLQTFDQSKLLQRAYTRRCRCFCFALFSLLSVSFFIGYEEGYSAGRFYQQGPGRQVKPIKAANGIQLTDEPRPRSGWIYPDEVLLDDHAVDDGAAPSITTLTSKPRGVAHGRVP